MKKPNFKHIGGDGFPHGNNVDVYKYTNDIDYKRFDATQMKITLCKVPWDIGQAHIGQRTIDGIGNVVYFGTKEKRNAWFDSLADDKCYRFETKFKELHRERKIKVPIPYDVAVKFNYIWVEYAAFANDESLLKYESTDGVRHFGYFARNIIFEAPNTTTIELLEDVWQTFIYDVEITNMILERGHAPLVETSVDAYLENPIENSIYLLEQDVNFGEIQKSVYTNAISLNSENIKACIVSTSDLKAKWQTSETITKEIETVDRVGNVKVEAVEVEDIKDFTPAKPSNIVSGVPTYNIFSCDVENLTLLLEILENTRPQFKQSVKAIFFIEDKYIKVDTPFTLTYGKQSVEVSEVLSNNVDSRELLHLSKEQFNFNSKYREIAKLYTYPYSAIELTDENGNTSLVKIEETNGQIDINLTASLVLPALQIQGTISGIGGTTSTTLSFGNVDKKTFTTSGRWYEYIREWNVPTFSVILDSSKEFEYSSKYDLIQKHNDNSLTRENEFRSESNSWNIANRSANTQRAITSKNAENTKTNADIRADFEYDNVVDNATVTASTGNNIAGAIRDNTKSTNTLVKNNADASAATTKTNATESATIAKANADRNAAAIKLNATAQQACNTTVFDKSRDSQLSDVTLGNALNTAKQAYSAGYTYSTTNEQTQTEAQQAMVGVAGNVMSSAVSGAVAGSVGGPVGAGVGAVAGLVSAIPNAITTGINTQLSVNLQKAIADLTVENSQNDLSATNTNNTERTQTTINCEDGQRTAQNTLTETSANISASTLSTNATWDQTLANANAERMRSLYQDTINPNTKSTNDGIADNLYNATINNNNSIKDTSINKVATRTRDQQKIINKNNYDTTIYNSYHEGDLDDNIYREQWLTACNNLQTSKQNTCNVYANEQDRIANVIKQANLRAPFEYGGISNVETSTTRPQALYANIVRQSDDAIRRAGDEMLRYGYTYNAYYEFDGNWCKAPKFTYWKLKDYWIKNLELQDYYQDAIRFFLMGGVTVWSDPADLGKASIYDNK